MALALTLGVFSAFLCWHIGETAKQEIEYEVYVSKLHSAGASLYVRSVQQEIVIQWLHADNQEMRKRLDSKGAHKRF